MSLMMEGIAGAVAVGVTGVTVQALCSCWGFVTDMARIQPSLTKAESSLIDQVAELTHTKRTEVIKNALAVYHWFVRQAVTGAHVIARKPTGEEVTLETPELASLESRGRKLSPKDLGLLARKLSESSDSAAAAKLKERLARGFYGI